MRDFDTIILENIYNKIILENNLSYFLNIGDFKSAQILVDNGAKMDKKTFVNSIKPDKTQIGTKIHIRLEKDGIISKNDFIDGELPTS
jgi:hypothetical protein